MSTIAKRCLFMLCRILVVVRLFSATYAICPARGSGVIQCANIGIFFIIAKFFFVRVDFGANSSPADAVQLAEGCGDRVSGG